MMSSISTIVGVNQVVGQQVVHAKLDAFGRRIWFVSHFNFRFSELIQTLGRTTAYLNRCPEPFRFDYGGSCVGEQIRIERNLCVLFRVGRCIEIVHAIRQMFDFLIVYDYVSAHGIVKIVDWRTSVLHCHFFHVLGFFGREAIECDAQRVQRFQFEVFYLFNATEK